MSKFKVGDRVFLRRLPGTIIGIKGSGNGCDYLFEHDIPGKGIHNGNGFVLTSGRYGKARNCEWGVATSFVSMSIPKIIITTDGKTTLARLYEDNKVVKRAEAKCAPGDEFSFEIGACIAVGRLYAREVSIDGVLAVKSEPKMSQPKTEYLVLDGCQPEPEQPKYYNGKVVCVKCPNLVGPYTPGKTYTFKDGFVQDDYGRWHPTPLSIVNPRNEPIRSFDDWQKHTRAKFIELKGENTH